MRRVCDGGNRGNRIATELYTEDSEGSDYRTEREGKMRRKTEGGREGGERRRRLEEKQVIHLPSLIVVVCVCHVASVTLSACRSWSFRC